MNSLLAEIEKAYLSHINVNELDYSKMYSSDICRACLGSKNLQSLFTQQSHIADGESILLKMFISCTALDVSQNDDYPKYICNSCLEDLYRAYVFWKKCRNSVGELDKLRGKTHTVYIKEETNPFPDVTRLDMADIKEEVNPLLYEVDVNLEEGGEIDMLNQRTTRNNSSPKKVTPVKTPGRRGRKPGSKNKKTKPKKYDSSSDEEFLSEIVSKSKPQPEVKAPEIDKDDDDGHDDRDDDFDDRDEDYKPEEEEEYAETKTSPAKEVYDGLKCNQCDKKLASEEERLKHICRSFACKYCNKKFDTYDKRYKHLRIHTQPHKCELCLKTYATSNALKVHERVHTGERPFPCNVCGKAFKTKGHLDNHSVRHTGERKHLCIYCDKTFIRSSLLNKHLKTHEEYQVDPRDIKEKVPPGERIFLCQICGRTLKTHKNLQQHIISHSDFRPYECKTCNKRFKFKSNLQVHELTHATEKKFECDQCGAKFLVRDSLKCHIKRRHSNVRPYVCKICSKGFKFSYKLTVHVRQHTGEKPYACQECSMAFVCSSRLKMHMLKHTGIRNYSCPVCDKRFLMPQHVKTHMITHTGECKHKCEICQRTFRYSQMLKNHMKTHGEPPRVQMTVNV
ncbi:zinc finger protein 431-like [Ctenocephalides felis]|uniref:zinc finger protein 431-like n=1 Tax=Ctenocephalides felis TaxID=7515 RepID=UPI000E6E1DB0|nr:zinc finger protein 431-like [Ctenocephalides felis]XP_026462511.1 zinc finger protein 431-like [Ctenocephalides felis]